MADFPRRAVATGTDDPSAIISDSDQRVSILAIPSRATSIDNSKFLETYLSPNLMLT